MSYGTNDASGEACERCRECSAKGMAYCTKCGRPVGALKRASPAPAPKSEFGAAANVIGVALTIVLTAFIFFEIFMIFWGFGDIWANIGSYNGVYILILDPMPAALFFMTGGASKAYYLFLAASVLISFAVLIRVSRKDLRKIFRPETSVLENMPLYSIATLFAAYMSFAFIFSILLSLAGVTTNTPVFTDEWDDWYDLLNASVWEEVLCRVLLIGAPLVLVSLYLGTDRPLRRLFGGSGMNGYALVFIFISTAVFALAHLPGWDAWKLIPMVFSGIMLGYLFVKYGLYASIMMHFLVDYMSTPTWIFGDAGDAFLTMLLLAISFLGVIFIVRYAKRGYVYMKGLLA